ncbi:hypothetical protein BpHYR1_020663 [Brachionus plicatilis]|uniref:Uncharacterized protein n=1 Tax=Brachionus plicatilis TaxID=10195 RepID=A0A3M7T6X3_BRAPC|nr:hypothetical protein BpHYR1_020663 [Brachionus plicatilis]
MTRNLPLQSVMVFFKISLIRRRGINKKNFDSKHFGYPKINFKIMEQVTKIVGCHGVGRMMLEVLTKSSIGFGEMVTLSGYPFLCSYNNDDVVDDSDIESETLHRKRKRSKGKVYNVHNNYQLFDKALEDLNKLGN